MIRILCQISSIYIIIYDLYVPFDRIFSTVTKHKKQNKIKVFGIKAIFSRYMLTTMSTIEIKSVVNTRNYKMSKHVIKQNISKIIIDT